MDRSLLKFGRKLPCKFLSVIRKANASTCQCDLGWSMHQNQSACLDVNECILEPCQENASQGSSDKE